MCTSGFCVDFFVVAVVVVVYTACCFQGQQSMVMPAKAFMMRMATTGHRPSRNYTNHKSYLLSTFSLSLLITSSVTQVAMMAREMMPMIICVLMPLCTMAAFRLYLFTVCM